MGWSIGSNQRSRLGKCGSIRYNQNGGPQQEAKRIVRIHSYMNLHLFLSFFFLWHNPYLEADAQSSFPLFRVDKRSKPVSPCNITAPKYVDRCNGKHVFLRWLWCFRFQSHECEWQLYRVEEVVFWTTCIITFLMHRKPFLHVVTLSSSHHFVADVVTAIK